MKTQCSFCKKPGSFATCTCGYNRELDCAGKPACGSCQAAHAKIGAFTRALLKTQPTERSNSARAKFIEILRNVIARNRSEIRESKHALTTLGRTSPWDNDRANFAGCIREAVGCLSLTAPIAADLVKYFNEKNVERVLGNLADVIAVSNAKREADGQIGMALDRVLLELKTRADIAELRAL